MKLYSFLERKNKGNKIHYATHGTRTIELWPHEQRRGGRGGVVKWGIGGGDIMRVGSGYKVGAEPLAKC